MGAYTGALVGTEAERNDIGQDKRAHAAFLRDMQDKCRRCWKRGQAERTCDDISLQWPGAAPPPLRVLCDEYFDSCFKLWDDHARTLTAAQSSSGSKPAQVASGKNSKTKKASVTGFVGWMKTGLK